MREIGGYIELDTYHLPMLHEQAIALNCGRNALAYILKARKIRKIKIPYFLCDSVMNVCKRENVCVSLYHIGIDFKPVDVCLVDDEWLYLVNYYGQLTNEDIGRYVKEYKRVIVDQSHSYFQMPFEGVDTLYTCRKWFGVADGAFLYTDSVLNEEIPVDISYGRMRFLLGRLEGTASAFYPEYTANNKLFSNEPIKKMSKLTRNLLHGIDYETVRKKREENYRIVHSVLGAKNRLVVEQADFMYPFMIENGKEIRKRLQQAMIYIPTLWPSVYGFVNPSDIEYKMAEDILPLPIDQRYDIADMEYMCQEVCQCIS